MRRIFATVLSVVLALSLFVVPNSTYASSKAPTVVINGKITKFSNDPRVELGTTMVPFREIFEALGVKVSYDPATKSITSTQNDTTVVVFIGQKAATKNGKPMQLSIAPYVDKGVTFVPLRFVSEAYGASVNYSNNTITINTTGNSSSSSSSSSNNSSQNDLTALAEKLSKQVVSITTFDSKAQPIGVGSGVIVSSTGEILTNYHVIEGAYSVSVYTSDKEYKTSTVLSVDAKRDLALLKVEANNLNAALFGDSTATKMGESIIALGSPLGFSNTLSTGVISNVSRTIEGSEFIQITAPIDHGNSGGGLFNYKGELIGIITAKVDSSANINLAIPSKDVKVFLNQPKAEKLLPVEGTSISPDKLAVVVKIYNLLSEEFEVLSYGDLELDVYWSVFYDSEDEDYVVVMHLQNYNEFLELMELHYSSYPEDVIGDLHFYIANDVIYKELKIEKLFIISGIEDRINYKPTDIPTNYYDYKYGTYEVYYPFASSYYNYPENNFGVYIEPENNGTYTDFYIY